MKNQDASQLFSVVGEKNRLKIIQLCFQGEQSVDQLLAKTQLEKSLLSKHLKILREASILCVKRSGRTASYSIHKKVCKNLLNKTLNLPCCDIAIK